MRVNDPVAGEMQYEVLAVGMDSRQARAVDVRCPFAPAGRHVDPIHLLPDQLSQRVTPPRNRMTFCHPLILTSCAR